MSGEKNNLGDDAVPFVVDTGFSGVAGNRRPEEIAKKKKKEEKGRFSLYSGHFMGERIAGV